LEILTANFVMTHNTWLDGSEHWLSTAGHVQVLTVCNIPRASEEDSAASGRQEDNGMMKNKPSTISVLKWKK
jgi:hypothetical protein